MTATLSPDDSEFLTAAHRRVVLCAPLEPFFVRARHRAAAVLAAFGGVMVMLDPR